MVLINNNKLVIIDAETVYEATVNRISSVSEFAYTLSQNVLPPKSIELETCTILYNQDGSYTSYRIVQEMYMPLTVSFNTKPIPDSGEEGKTKLMPYTTLINAKAGAEAVNVQVRMASTNDKKLVVCYSSGSSSPYLFMLDVNARRSRLLPLPNIYDDGRVCLGGENHIPDRPDSSIVAILGFLQSAMPNGDLFDGNKQASCNAACKIDENLELTWDLSQLRTISSKSVDIVSAHILEKLQAQTGETNNNG